MLPDAPTPTNPPTASDVSPTGPGFVAGPAPAPVGARPRPVGSVVLAVAVAVVAILGGGGLFLSGYALGVHQAAMPGTSSSDAAAFGPFWDAYHNITTKFPLGPVDRQALVEGAIKGMVEALGDPYSSYLTPEEFQTTLSDISGEFEGIGAEIGTVDAKGATADCNSLGPDCRLVVIAPLDGSPAQAAGLKPGDVIATVDGQSLDGLSVGQATGLIRGQAGTQVTLHVERAGAAAFDVTITRAKIQRREVVTRDLANGTVGYVRLAGFSDTGADAFVAAVKADVAKGQTKLIVDLRGNPGGFVNDATKVASAFIGSGTIFWQEDAQGNFTPTAATPGGPATDPAIKVVVLVDKGSASASEIVAGALKDTGRATIVGETTFGKGTVQVWIPLGTNGDAGGIKLTVAKWLTPDKTWIHGVGIAPDVPVTVPANTPAGSDPALDKALEVLGASSASGPTGQAELELAA
jgi:carboxyl-terminal processing protease